MAPATPRPAASLILLRRGGKHRQRGRRGPAGAAQPGGELHARRLGVPWRRGRGRRVRGARGRSEAGAADGEELAHRACAARELHEEAGIELSADAELRPWSRWITPEVVPVRFDTRFYVALAPPHSPPRPDGAETTEAAWISPREALDRHAAGELSLVFPTIKHLESLLPYSSAEEVLAAARERRIEPILPRVLGAG